LIFRVSADETGSWEEHRRLCGPVPRSCG
jgi:hypothetical protein